MMAFNSDEDLVLMTNEGRIFIVDVYHGKILHDVWVQGVQVGNDLIEDCKIQAW